MFKIAILQFANILYHSFILSCFLYIFCIYKTHGINLGVLREKLSGFKD